MAKGSKVTATSYSNITPNEDNDDDNEKEMSFLHEMAILYNYLRGNDKARVKFEYLMDTVYKNKETIEEFKSLVIERKWRFNLLKQELSDEKHANSLVTQQIESYEPEKEKSINDWCP
jgi:hypothetical protein